MDNNLNMESFEYIPVGSLRFIGVDAWLCNDGKGEEWDKLWSRKGEFMPLLESLSKEYGCDIDSEGAMMHHRNKEVDTENHYLVGKFFKAGTPVPEGYSFFDVPTDSAAYAVFSVKNFNGDTWPAYYATRDKILSEGRSVPYPVNYWHCELYINGRTIDKDLRYAYLFSMI